MAVVAVPETALRHNNGAVAREYDIRFARQRFIMQPEPEARRVQSFA